MLKGIKRITWFFIYSNLFVAFAVSCFTYETLLLFLHPHIDYHYLAFVFFSTFFLYNFHRWFGLTKRKKEELTGRYEWIKKHNTLFYFFILVSAGGVAYLASFLGKEIFLLLLPLAALAFGYTLPILKTSKGWMRLRDIPGMKVFLIIVVCAVVTTVLPFVYHRQIQFLYEAGFWLYFLNRSLFLLAITIPFDMRDMEYDKATNLKTIPVLLGEKKAKQVCYYSFILSLVPLFFLHNLRLVITNLVVVLLGIFIVYRINAQKKENYYALLLEGLMIARLAMILFIY